MKAYTLTDTYERAHMCRNTWVCTHTQIHMHNGSDKLTDHNILKANAKPIAVRLHSWPSAGRCQGWGGDSCTALEALQRSPGPQWRCAHSEMTCQDDCGLPTTAFESFYFVFGKLFKAICQVLNTSPAFPMNLNASSVPWLEPPPRSSIFSVHAHNMWLQHDACLLLKHFPEGPAIGKLRGKWGLPLHQPLAHLFHFWAYAQRTPYSTTEILAQSCPFCSIHSSPEMELA